MQWRNAARRDAVGSTRLFPCRIGRCLARRQRGVAGVDAYGKLGVGLCVLMGAVHLRVFYSVVMCVWVYICVCACAAAAAACSAVTCAARAPSTTAHRPHPMRTRVSGGSDASLLRDAHMVLASPSNVIPQPQVKRVSPACTPRARAPAVMWWRRALCSLAPACLPAALSRKRSTPRRLSRGEPAGSNSPAHPGGAPAHR